MNKNHWIALSIVGCQTAYNLIFDSNGGKEKLISALLQTQEDQFSVEFIDVQMQEGSHDCGLFTVAYITSICNGQDPAILLYKQNAMRKHILKSIEDGVMTAFPSSASRHPKASIRKNTPVYCIYQHINELMIQCDICQCSVVPCSLHEDQQRWSQRSQVNVELPFVQYKLITTTCNSLTCKLYIYISAACCYILGSCKPHVSIIGQLLYQCP